MNSLPTIRRRVYRSRSLMPLHHPPYLDEWENPNCRVYSFLCRAPAAAIAWALAPLPFTALSDLVEVCIFDQSTHTYGGYETGIAIPVRYGRKVGSCFVQHYVTSDVALMAGREFFGYPKLFGDVKFSRQAGGRFRCTTDRRGARILSIAGRVTRAPGADPADFVPGFPRGTALFGHLLQVKAFPRADRPGAALRQVIYRDLNVRVKQSFRIEGGRIGLRGTEFDPLDQFAPLELVSASVHELSYGGGWKKEKRRVLADLTRSRSLR